MHAHTKREISLRYFLQGAEYFLALEAMQFAQQYHRGVRKDGVTPEFDHQISIAHFVRTLRHQLVQPEHTLCGHATRCARRLRSERSRDPGTVWH